MCSTRRRTATATYALRNDDNPDSDSADEAGEVMSREDWWRGVRMQDHAGPLDGYDRALACVRTLPTPLLYEGFFLFRA